MYIKCFSHIYSFAWFVHNCTNTLYHPRQRQFNLQGSRGMLLSQHSSLCSYLSCQVFEQVVHHIALFRLGTQPIACEVQQRGRFYGCIQVLGVECFCFVYKGDAAVGAITFCSSVGLGNRHPNTVQGQAVGHCRNSVVETKLLSWLSYSIIK